MWYSVSVFFRSDSDGEESLWEEQIILVNGDSEEIARQVGEDWGKRDETAFVGISGNNVHWSFQCVSRVYAIDGDALSTGTELFSRFLRAAEARSLLMPFE